MRASLLVFLAACGTGVPGDPGLDALLQIDGAQYRPGAFPTDEGGPSATQVSPRNSNIPIGAYTTKTRGLMAPEARTALVGIDGIDGAWLVVADAPDVDVPGSASAHFGIALAVDFPPGPFTLKLAGADAHGRFGAAVSTDLIAAELPPPEGTLVIGLSWSGAPDLDLHVVDALGGEAWADKPNTMIPPVPGAPPDPDGWKRFGTLDHDGNMGCTQNAHPDEHVIWTMDPPSGDYVVRVDTRSMCGAPSTSWYVDVYRDGALIDASRGLSTPGDVEIDVDTIGLGRAGAGVNALRFSL